MEVITSQLLFATSLICIKNVSKEIFTNVTCVVLDMLVEVEDIKDVIKVDVGKVVRVVVLSIGVLLLVALVVVVGVVDSFIGSNDIDNVVVAVVVGVVDSFIGSDDINNVVVVVVVVGGGGRGGGGGGVGVVGV